MLLNESRSPERQNRGQNLELSATLSSLRSEKGDGGRASDLPALLNEDAMKSPET